jgi:SAM-dependent methyltransferase
LPTDPELYRRRIAAIGFEGLGDVLDAGCGFGQWTFALAEANRSVAAVDVSDVRVRVVGDIAARLGAGNVSAHLSSIEETPFEDGSFDAIFSYSVIYFTDFRRTVAEFRRLLRPGGRLYICSNGLGWYLHNLLSGHNPSPTFDPRAMAIATLDNSISYYATGRHEQGRQIVMPSALLCDTLREAGFAIEACGPEGNVAVPGRESGPSFYNGSYHGAEGVYEVIARKTD